MRPATFIRYWSCYQYVVSLKHNLIQRVEFTPTMNDRRGIDLSDAQENAGPQFFPGIDADVFQKGASHLPKQGLDSY